MVRNFTTWGSQIIYKSRKILFSKKLASFLCNKQEKSSIQNSNTDVKLNEFTKLEIQVQTFLQNKDELSKTYFVIKDSVFKLLGADS